MAREIDRAILAKARLFRGLDEAALDEVARAAHLSHVSAGASFLSQDDEADAFYILTSGRVKIAQLSAEGHQVVLRYIGPGELFGAVPVFCGTHYPADAIAVVESIAARWDKPAVQQLMARHPAFMANALSIVGARLQELQQRYRELATERVERRIARAILRLAEQAGKPVAEGVRIAFPLSRQDIAEMTGTTLHTVSRILSAWEEQGLLESGRQRITLREPKALLAIAEDLAPHPGGSEH